MEAVRFPQGVVSASAGFVRIGCCCDGRTFECRGVVVSLDELWQSWKRSDPEWERIVWEMPPAPDGGERCVGCLRFVLVCTADDGETLSWATLGGRQEDRHLQIVTPHIYRAGLNIFAVEFYGWRTSQRVWLPGRKRERRFVSADDAYAVWKKDPPLAG